MRLGRVRVQAPQALTCDKHVSMFITCQCLIQIRNVPEALHRRAKAKAAMEGVTLSDLALRALRKELRRLSIDESER